MYKFFQDNIINPFSFTQLIKSPTRITDTTCTLIDLILVNSPQNVKFTGTADFSGISDHKFIYCSYSLKKPKFKPQIVKRRDFRKFAQDKFITDMQNANWNNVLGVADQNIDEATTNFEKTFSDIINSNAPIREIKVCEPVDASWMSDEITFLMDLRDKYKNKWNEIKRYNVLNHIQNSPGDIIFYTRFKELKNQVNHKIRNAKYVDFNSKINSKIKDSKNLHANFKNFNVVNSKKNHEGKCLLDPNKLNESFVKSKGSV